MNIEITLKAHKDEEQSDKELVIQPYDHGHLLLQILRHGNCDDSIIVSIDELRLAMRKVATK